MAREKEVSQTWSDHLTCIVTVWGLGMGTAVSLCLLAGLCLYFHVSEFIFCFLLGGITGVTLGVGTLYQRFVQQHVRTPLKAGDPISEGIAYDPISQGIASVIGNAVFFFVAFLVAFLALLVLIGFIVSLEARRRKEMTFAQKTDRYLGRIVPPMLFSK